MTTRFQIRVLIACAFAAGSFFGVPVLRAADEVSFPKESPAFKVPVPDGWEGKGLLGGPGLNNRKGLYVDFKKLSATDEKTAMTATEALAKDKVAFDKDIKTDEPIAPLPAEVAGHKAYQIVMSSESMPPDRTSYQVVGFTIDGKAYYAAIIIGSPNVLKEASEDIAAILASITPAN